jgi:hypothetical protein
MLDFLITYSILKLKSDNELQRNIPQDRDAVSHFLGFGGLGFPLLIASVDTIDAPPPFNPSWFILSASN